MIVYRRKNPRHKARRSKARKSRSRSRARRRNPSKHRITAYKSKGKWTVHRKRSRLFRRSKSRSIRIRNPFRIPKLGGFVPSKSFAMTAVGVVGGFAISKTISPYFLKIPGLGSASPKMQSIIVGALNLVVGAYAAGKLKGELIKGAGIGIAASGVLTIAKAALPESMQRFLGVDLSSDGLPPAMGYNPMGEEMVRVGDEMVRVGADLSADEESVYERI